MVVATEAHTEADPLPSWNDGAVNGDMTEAGAVARTSRALGAGGGEHRDAIGSYSAWHPCFVALLVAPCSALAQTATNTDAAIAELRQLLAEQRAALDHQARIIEEQGRTLTALQRQVDGANQSTQERRAPQQPTGRTAAEQGPDLPAAVVSAGEFPGSIRIPGTESAFKLGGQARMVAVHTLERPRD